MRDHSLRSCRRRFLAGSLSAAAGLVLGASTAAEQRKALAADDRKALIAITLDLEMSRNFPTWETTHWDYEKGNLNAETKKYTVEACRRVKAAGGVLHCFAVGRVLEQDKVDWLKGIVEQGHPVGNHTYDHVNVRAKKPADIQFRFQRAPWLIEGKTPREVIAENIRLCSAALQTRIGIKPAGFRTPGGFSDGLADRPDLQQMLLDQGFTWVSSKYPAHPLGPSGMEPSSKVLDAIVKAQAAAQPFVYPRGLVEVPMSPISDIGAFRNGRWKLESFLKAIRLAVEWTIAHRAAFDFLGHPSCLYVTDPRFRTIDLICDLVKKAGDRAALVDVGTLAERGKIRMRKTEG
jgi:peptidoglycan/xylan/chitin deacetylase (PgdA/CDA1 family)